MTARALKGKVSDIRRIARLHGVSRVRVFGSHAAGRASRSSDLDLLITLQNDRDLLDLVDFKLDLQDLLGCDVDVVTENGLSPYLRKTILRTAKPL
ncbi:MAG: nucleotidyltransferase family protein [Nitrospira sp.]|nr:nucleotidyltransferase family protein [Nitrospira sp.]